MEEKFESFFYHQDPFYSVQLPDLWKQSVQEAVNEVVGQVLLFPPESRLTSRLIEIFKSAWFSRMQTTGFAHDTSYYLWLVHVSGLLLPLLEKDSGTLNGWLQYRPSTQAKAPFTVPVVKEEDRLKLYLFETDPVVLSQIAEAVALQASYSSADLPELLQMDSVGDGRSSIHTLTHTHRRKQDW